MNAIEFACTVDEIAKRLKVEFDSDLVGKIYDIYEVSYENYTLLELIGLLNQKNIEITCPWNKKAIIQMISEKNISLPIKKGEIEPTKWEHYRVRKSLDVIETANMEFYDGSIIEMPDGQPYMIDCITSSRKLISEDLPYDQDS